MFPMYLLITRILKPRESYQPSETLAFTLHKQIKDPLCRFLILICDLNAITYTLVNVYSPQQAPSPFLNKLMKKVKSHQRGLLIICGDFNATPNLTMDSTSKTTHHHPTLLPSIRKQNVHHTWHCLHAGEKDSTFFSPPHRVYTRNAPFFSGQVFIANQICYYQLHNMVWPHINNYIYN